MSGRSHPDEALDYAAAVPEDAAACIALRGRTRENAIPAERLADAGITTESWAHDIRTGALPGCVCREAGRMLGYCFGSVSDGEIVVLAVLPEAEQRGIGRALLSRMVDTLAAAGRTRLFLGCSPDPLHRSHGFYRHLGWRSTGRFDRHGDELLEYHVRRLVLREADPQGQDALDLLRLAADEARSLYPELHDPRLPPPSNPPTPERGVYLVGYDDGRPVAMGAHRPVDLETSEIRRMYVLPLVRRRGAARTMLAALEAHALNAGFSRVRLETGFRQMAAMRLYESCGYAPIVAFGPYANDPTSVCYEKALVKS